LSRLKFNSKEQSVVRGSIVLISTPLHLGRQLLARKPSLAEEHLAKVESSSVPAYSGPLHGDIPSGSQARADFARFLGLMYSRTRAMRRMAAEMYVRFMQIQLYATASHPDAFDTSIGRYEEGVGRTLSPKEREGARAAMIDPSNFEFEIPKDRTFSVLATADKLAPLFFRMTWYVITATDLWWWRLRQQHGGDHVFPIAAEAAARGVAER
jgi:hypothetical protein